MLGLAVVDLLCLAAAFWIAGRACAALAGTAWPRGAGFSEEIALGLGVWMAAVGTLAATGVLSARVLVALVVVCDLAALGFLIARRWWTRWPGRPRVTFGGLLFGGSVAFVLAALFVHAAFPSLAWDAAVYHLALPKRMLASGGFARIPLNFQSLWPLGMELIDAVALAWRGPQLASALQWACGVVLLADIAREARRSGLPPAAASAAVAILLASPVVLEQMGIAYVDLAFTLFLWLAFTAVRRALAGEDAGPNLLLAGVFLGILSGIKLTGVLACASLGGLWLGSRLVRRSTGDPGTWRGLLRLAIPVVLLVLPWHVRMWRVTGNPVYPFAYARFGGIEWSPRLVDQLTAYRDSTGFGRTARDFLLLPARLLLAPDLHRAVPAEPSWLAPARGFIGFDGELGPIWLLAVPLALWGCRRSGLARAAMGASAIYLVGWSLTSQQMRFVLPVLPLMAIAAACGVQDLVARVRGGAAAWAPPAVLCGAALLVLAAARGDAALARRQLSTMRSVGPALAQRLVPPVYRFLNTATPADARVLFVNNNKGYHCDRDYLADSVFEASQVADWLRGAEDAEGVRRLLRDAAVTHVLFERVDWGIDYPASFLGWLQDPERAAPVFRSDDGRFTVLEVR